MKKILLVASTVLLTAMATFAQEPDPVIESQFATDFPNATNAHFARVKNLNEVSFTQDKDIVTAYYDARDQLIGTIHEQSFADLPDNAQKEIRNKYPGYSIGNVVKFDDNQSDDNYFAELKNDSKSIVLKIDLIGEVDYLTSMD
jgi:hypothetical protein